MGKDLCVKGIYGSGMVLQHDKINCIYGTGDIFSDVIMSFRGVTSITQVDENGEWKFEFSPGEAGGPFVMTIKSDAQKIEFTDIYVGEVWLNAGGGNAKQSMDEMKYSYPEEFALKEKLNVHMISIPVNYSFTEKTDYINNPKWEVVSPETMGNMPGLSYFFGKKLSVDLGVPVGIINMTYEDIPICSWLSRKALEEMGDKDKDLKTLAYYKNPENVKQAEEQQEELNNWYKKMEQSNEKLLSLTNSDIDNSWTTCNIPGSITDSESSGRMWLRKDIELTKEQISNFKNASDNNTANLWLGLISCPEEVYFNGIKIGATSSISKSRRFKVPVKLFVEGRNVLLIKVIKDKKELRFYEEKKYCLFSDNVFTAPCVYRNICLKDQSLAPVDGEYISLEGEWKLKSNITIVNIPSATNIVAQPTALFHGVLPSCFKYAMAGVLWTHGESDLDRAGEYKGLLTKLITLWRRRFTYWSRDLPFIIVQLPNWCNKEKEGAVSLNSSLAVIRKAQSDVAEMIDKVGLVVAIDAGEWNDLYAEKKLTLGTRCELEALRVAYGKSYISAAPKVNFYEAGTDKYTVKFNCGNSSLHTFKVSGMSANLNRESEDGKVYGFSFLYKKNGCINTIKADARLVNPFTVEITVPLECTENNRENNKIEIMELRYLWSDSPAPVNLYTRDMIPAGPFSITLK